MRPSRAGSSHAEESRPPKRHLTTRSSPLLACTNPAGMRGSAGSDASTACRYALARMFAAMIIRCEATTHGSTLLGVGIGGACPKSAFGVTPRAPVAARRFSSSNQLRTTLTWAGGPLHQRLQHQAPLAVRSARYRLPIGRGSFVGFFKRRAAAFPRSASATGHADGHHGVAISIEQLLPFGDQTGSLPPSVETGIFSPGPGKGRMEISLRPDSLTVREPRPSGENAGPPGQTEFRGRRLACRSDRDGTARALQVPGARQQMPAHHSASRKIGN